MEYSLIFTIVGTGLATGLAVIGSNIALISWLRSDMKSFENEVRNWREDTHQEMKDFHGRLCAIEERNKEKSLN